MRILILNWRDIKHPLAGGAELSTHEHAKKWISAGHEVVQFSSMFPQARKSETIDGVKIVRAGNHYTVHVHALIYFLRKLKGSIDLVVDEFHFIPFFTPLYIHVKKIAFIHETAEETWYKNIGFPLNFVGHFIEPFIFLLYKNVPFITVSNSTRQDLLKFGIKDKMIHIIFNGLTKIDSKKPKETIPVVLYLGKLAKDKGIEDAVSVFGIIHGLRKDIQFWMTGREEKKGMLKELKNVSRKNKLDNNIKFTGFVSEKEKFDLLKRAWILIHPSLKEGWGLTVIEAASQGTPTIGYKTEGLQDSIKQNETGFLVRRGDIEELAKKTIDLINDKDLFIKLSKNAIIWSERFIWNKSTSQSLSLIESL